MRKLLSLAGMALALTAGVGAISPGPAKAQEGGTPRSASPPISAFQATLPPSAATKEMEKIHDLAKECIQANNTSTACAEILKLDTERARIFIQKESIRAKREAQ